MQRASAWKVAVAVARKLFGHRHESEPAPGSPKGRTGYTHRSWLQREDDAISHGSSSLFFLSHDRPQAPAVTCIQGHEVDPGETTCHLGHPAG
jgi:hypothetical protein